MNCKLCAGLIPYLKAKSCGRDIPVRQLKLEIDAVFRLFDYIDDVTLSGGEPLMHPDIAPVAEYCIQFRDKFEHLRIFTNGTIVPKPDLMSLLQKHSDFFELVVDDYGLDTSRKVPEIKGMFSKQNLLLRINRYHGDRQHYNGWVDYGSPEYGRGYSESQLRDVFLNCHSGQHKCVIVWDGNISNCGWTMFGVDGKLFPDSDEVAKHDLVPLLDPTLSDEEKCRRIAEFGKVPLLACQYCNGFDIEKSTRYSAGEQI